jgi:peptidoglycan hydrolase-like protein with peptidoglycan-binding domain
VKLLQIALIALGNPMPVSTAFGTAAPDGVFGNETTGAVKAFQRQSGIADDGIVGPMTMGRLDFALSAGRDPLQSAADAVFAACRGLVTSKFNSRPTDTDAQKFSAAIRRLETATAGDSNTILVTLKRVLDATR